MKILVGIPLERNLTDMAFLAFWQIARRGYQIVDEGYGRVDCHRNSFARAVLDSDCTHLCMLDSDHVHPPNIVERLARWAAADEERFKVVAGLNFRRGEPFEPLAFVRNGNGQYHPIAEWPAGLFKVDVAAPCAMLIHRSVFETIPEPWWAYEYKNGKSPSEDMYFCERCAEYGIEVWVDGDTTSPHLFNNVVTGDTFKSWLAAHQETIMPAEVD